MSLIRLSKISLIGAAVLCVVAVPWAMRQVVGQGVESPHTGLAARANPDRVEIATEVQANDQPPGVKLEVQPPAANSEVDPFAQSHGVDPSAQSGEVDPFAHPGGVGTDAQPGRAGNPASTGNAAPDAPPSPTRRFDLARRSAVEEGIEETLQMETSFDFLEEPLTDALQFFKSFHGIQIVLDAKAIEDVGIARDAPLTAQLKDISLASALRHLLRPLGLTFIIRDEVLTITTPDVAASATEMRVYRRPEKMGFSDTEALVKHMTGAIAPETWQEVGGEGYCAAYGNGIIVVNTKEVHDQINDLLRQLEQLAPPAEVAP